MLVPTTLIAVRDIVAALRDEDENWGNDQSIGDILNKAVTQLNQAVRITTGLASGQPEDIKRWLRS